MYIIVFGQLHKSNKFYSISFPQSSHIFSKVYSSCRRLQLTEKQQSRVVAYFMVIPEAHGGQYSSQKDLQLSNANTAVLQG